MSIFDYILDLIYPRKCVFCGKVLDETDICSACAEKLPYTKGDEAFQKLAFIPKCVSPLYYEDAVRESFLRYKFAGVQAYAARYGLIMSECIENNLDCSAIDVISCVPLSKKRLRKRGYNQAQLLAKEISASLGIPFRPLLCKIKDNPAQSGTKSAKERANNVVGVYSIQANADIEGKTVLLVDDIVTTGATLSECARVLRKAGAGQVYAATLARKRD